METVVAACPVCDAEIPLAGATEESEILHCWDCSTKLVAIWVEQNNITLSQAPAIEEET
ncbi:lysine biosynthesis protein LysW [bacterium]|nr:lysine biosynthesis protein LysW [bacterium]